MSYHCSVCGTGLTRQQAESDTPCPTCEENRQNRAVIKQLGETQAATLAILQLIAAKIKEDLPPATCSVHIGYPLTLRAGDDGALVVMPCETCLHDAMHSAGG